MTRSGGAVAIDARIAGRSHRLERRNGVAEYRSDTLRATLDATTWTLVDARAEGTPAEGDALDLAACALLIALLHAEPALPPVTPSAAEVVGI